MQDMKFQHNSINAVPLIYFSAASPSAVGSTNFGETSIVERRKVDFELVFSFSHSLSECNENIFISKTDQK